MPNGKPGDHPLTDILVHRHVVYGEGVEEVVRTVAAECSESEREFLASLLFWWPEGGPDGCSTARQLKRVLDDFLRLVNAGRG